MAKVLQNGIWIIQCRKYTNATLLHIMLIRSFVVSLPATT